MADNRDPLGCLILEQHPLPLVDDLESLSQTLRSRLYKSASKPRIKRNVDRQVITDIVLQLCEGRLIMLLCLAELVKRKPGTLRDRYLKTLFRQWQLNLAFPKTPSQERQAYTTVKPSNP
ncbi:hypothetical protein KBZ19_01360 [Synechococcus sp. L2F]|uniref:hypothetical protein n=1 Tax=Synechococcus sp. L2F TaxID=2823739 RepID=UPI0020CFA762|nr:hypothetical protein [Synechococcus sp. L2F]MCP9827138.1 hypothetical protein [Synechococcus sp. L2F]